MESTTRSYDGWIGTDAYDSNGDRVGSIKDIYYDDATGKPEWLAVNTGLFGVRSSVVPITGTSLFNENQLQLPFTKDQIKDAPNVDIDTPMTDMEEQRLYDHYGYNWGDRSVTAYGETYATTPRADADFTVADQGTQPIAGEVVAEETVRNERAVVEEQPKTVRLRKYRWTEMVPVEHEEVRIEGDASATELEETGEGFTRPGR
jgi:sporulation protein YlmC with PRC-barrel domain